MTIDYKTRIDDKYIKHMMDIKDQVQGIKKESVERELRLLEKASYGSSSLSNKELLDMEVIKKANKNFS